MRLYNIYCYDNDGKKVYITTTDNFNKWLFQSNKQRMDDGNEIESEDYFKVEKVFLELFNKEEE